MTWTYTPTFLSASSTVTANFAAVRFMIGDTDTNRQQLQDEEIYYLLGAISAPNFAAAVAAEMLASKYAFLVNTENSELRVSAAARHKHYLEMADRLRKGGPGLVPGGDGSGIALAGMYGGGTDASAVEALVEDDDNILPQAATKQDDFDGTRTRVTPNDYFTDE